MNKICIIIFISSVFLSCRDASREKADELPSEAAAVDSSQVFSSEAKEDTTMSVLYQWLNNINTLRMNFERAENKALISPGVDPNDFLSIRTKQIQDPDSPDTPVELKIQDVLLKNGKKIILSDQWDDFEKLHSESYELLAYDNKNEVLYFLSRQVRMGWSLFAISLDNGNRTELYQSSELGGINELKACRDLSAVIGIVSNQEEGHFISIFNMKTGKKEIKRFSNNKDLKWDPNWVDCEGIVINKDELIY